MRNKYFTLIYFRKGFRYSKGSGNGNRRGIEVDEDVHTRRTERNASQMSRVRAVAAPLSMSMDEVGRGQWMRVKTEISNSLHELSCNLISCECTTQWEIHSTHYTTSL